MTEYAIYNKDLTICGWLVFASDRIRYVHNNSVSIEAARLILKALKGIDDGSRS